MKFKAGVAGLVVAIGAVLYGCSGGDSLATKLIQEQPAFADAIALAANPGFEPAKPCVSYPHPGGFVANFNGSLIWSGDNTNADTLDFLFNNKLGIYNTVVSNGQTWTCFIFAPSFHAAVDAANAKLADKSLALPQASDTPTELAIAYRSNIRLTFVNQYESEIPTKGKTKIVAATCDYDIEFLSDNLTAAGPGKCEGKWFLDNDTGKWTMMNFEARDPNILMTRRASNMEIGKAVISRSFQNGVAVEIGASLNNAPTSANLVADFTKADIGSDIVTITVWSRGGGSQVGGCNDIAIRSESGWVNCLINPTLNPGDYEFHLAVNGQWKNTYPFTVTTEHISRITITSAVVAREISNGQPVGSGGPFTAPTPAAIYVNYVDADAYRDVVTMSVATAAGQPVSRCSDYTVQAVNGSFWCGLTNQFAAGQYQFQVTVNGRQIGSYPFTVAAP